MTLALLALATLWLALCLPEQLTDLSIRRRALCWRARKS